ncbi:SulP family inorganic anion transporter [Conyzicola sp.]|uniref:SulP family inorganic anion transporter n=1 Tax=Conyzicola sp. TaxID=1969404 RepID=UPI003989DA5F
MGESSKPSPRYLASARVRRRLAEVRKVFRRKTLLQDTTAGVVLGIESVPDGLASGLLAGVNPVAGLYAYMFGLAGSAVFASSTFMAVQATGAMALVIADTDLASRPDPARALFTLSVLTGVFMIIAGALGGGRLLRFVPTAVMVGFVTAVGVNIVLGQLPNFTGVEGSGENRVARAVDTVIHPLLFDPATIAVAGLTLALIIVLTRTPLRSFGLVAAVAVGSLLAWLLNTLPNVQIAVVADIATIPSGLPTPVLPSLGDVAFLAIPALSLACVGLIQGAAVAAGVPNPGGRASDTSGDFIGQGAGNIVSGLFQGMPVGGSMSASALVVTAGAKTRLALFVASGVMGLTILLISGVVSQVAMPSLAALLIVVGVGAIKPAQIASVVKTGILQSTIMAVTFALTLLIPLQFAVLVGVGLGIILFVAEQSNRLRVRQITMRDDGRLRESDPSPAIGAEKVVVLQPYGSLFFASAPVFEAQLPRIEPATRRSVVVLRLRGRDQIGLALVEVLRRYARVLDEHDSRLFVITTSDRVTGQMAAGGLIGEIGEDAVYRADEWLGETTRRAYRDAEEWIRGH